MPGRRGDRQIVAEPELIARIAAALGVGGGGFERVVRGSGDDAAVVRARPFQVVSVDAMVDGAHFELRAAQPEHVGRRALAAGLSALAGMGAEPGEAYVALALPADFGDDEVLALARGM